MAVWFKNEVGLLLFICTFLFSNFQFTFGESMQTLYGTVGAGNYTFFTLKNVAPVKIVLTTRYESCTPHIALCIQHMSCKIQNVKMWSYYLKEHPLLPCLLVAIYQCFISWNFVFWGVVSFEVSHMYVVHGSGTISTVFPLQLHWRTLK